MRLSFCFREADNESRTVNLDRDGLAARCRHLGCDLWQSSQRTRSRFDRGFDHHIQRELHTCWPRIRWRKTIRCTWRNAARFFDFVHRRTAGDVVRADRIGPLDPDNDLRDWLHARPSRNQSDTILCMFWHRHFRCPRCGVCWEPVYTVRGLRSHDDFDLSAGHAPRRRKSQSWRTRLHWNFAFNFDCVFHVGHCLDMAPGWNTGLHSGRHSEPAVSRWEN